MSEEDLLAWLARRVGDEGRFADDAAILDTVPPVCVTVDSQIEGTHLLPGTDPRLAARRLVLVNLSDLAAMGAEPWLGFLALSAPPDYDRRGFLDAFVDCAEGYGLELRGGDLATTATLTASLTLVGRLPEGHRWVERRRAEIGDELWLGGSVGTSALGRHLLGLPLEGRPNGSDGPIRRHLAPEPQLRLGRWLGTRARSAAIDLSDGLAKDLHRLCSASRVGAEIDIDRLPIEPSCARLASELGLDPLELALAGGEDYVLLFALPSDLTPPSELGCHRVGRISASGVLARRGEHLAQLPPTGWDHLERSSS